MDVSINKQLIDLLLTIKYNKPYRRIAGRRIYIGEKKDFQSSYK